MSFLLIGDGKFFEHNPQPKNIDIQRGFLTPEQIPAVLDKAKAGLMLTRLDAQGVMMCEMATYGLPVVVSDLPICREMLNGFENTLFVDNDTLDADLEGFLKNIAHQVTPNKEKFHPATLACKEIEIFKQEVGELTC